MAKRTKDSAITWKPPEQKPLTDWLPFNGVSLADRWQGPYKKKPWDNKVTVTIPCLDVVEILPTCIASWKAQGDVNILLIDTGSSPAHSGYLDEIERMDPFVEVHRLRFKAVKHPSDPVAIAMDLAFSLCTTPYMFCTHADCFAARPDLIDDLVNDMEEGHIVSGYHITDREGLNVEGWVGHTATMFNMIEVDKLNLSWSQRRYCTQTGHCHYGEGRTNGVPDTEFLINYQLDNAGVPRKIIGYEENYVTTDDDNIIHVRSYGSSKMYSPVHFRKASIDMTNALKKTHERLKQWGV